MFYSGVNLELDWTRLISPRVTSHQFHHNPVAQPFSVHVIFPCEDAKARQWPVKAILYPYFTSFGVYTASNEVWIFIIALSTVKDGQVCSDCTRAPSHVSQWLCVVKWTRWGPYVTGVSSHCMSPIRKSPARYLRLYKMFPLRFRKISDNQLDL